MSLGPELSISHVNDAAISFKHIVKERFFVRLNEKGTAHAPSAHMLLQRLTSEERGGNTIAFEKYRKLCCDMALNYHLESGSHNLTHSNQSLAYSLWRLMPATARLQ